jgi:hypothetical protein
MLICQRCGAEFPVVLLVEGKRRDLRGRKHCVDCQPYRALKGPRLPVPRATKSLICAACGNAFPAKQRIDGKVRSLYRRRFCLECSPFGARNTSQIPYGLRSSEEFQLARRERRRESFRRSLHKRRRKRKRDLVEIYGGRCVDCGYSTCVEALQFHHRDPSTKDFSLGEFNGSLVRLLKEAEKCDLVCANCHQLRHAIEAKETSARVVQLRRETKLRAIGLFGGACYGCERTYPAAVLQFHHRDPAAKEFAMSTDGIYRRWEKIARELAKCVMLCANCHAEIHAGVRELPVDATGTCEPEPAVATAPGAA